MFPVGETDEKKENGETGKKPMCLNHRNLKKANLLKKAKDNLGQKLVETKFWQSFAETERVNTNGYKIDF